MFKEFKEFISKGNVIDLAVAVVLGAAFNAIITSIVDDLIMPLIGILLGGIDFSSLVITVGNAQITYGNLIQAIINFLIIAFVLFLIVRAYNSMQKQEKPAPTTKSCVYCFTDIPLKATRCPHCTSQLESAA
ncbi:MAG: large conductance mechanosensitive channel protein MscL [Anaerolineales bacterium]|jgi:large conductance mechanosensitive channel